MEATRTSHWKQITLGIVIVLLAALIAARLYLNIWLPDYVNRVLNEMDGYKGSIESLNIDLYRGAYRIHKLKIERQEGKIPVPFVDIEMVDLSIQWAALIHGRVVSNVQLEQPVLTFAVGQAGNEQTGAGVDWTKPIKDLMPIDINVVTFKDGQLSYRDFSTTPKVDVYIHHMSGEARNLRNVVDKDKPLPSTLLVRGDSIGEGNLNIQGRLNILQSPPDMDLDIKLEKVHLPALSNYSNAYASVDISDGNLDVYSQFIVKNNRVSGYVKPIATHVKLIDLRKSANPVKLAWETVVAGVVTLFTNQPHDQFATRIPLDGRLDNIGTDTWSAIGGIIRNAFIEAAKKGFENKTACLGHDCQTETKP